MSTSSTSLKTEIPETTQKTVRPPVPSITSVIDSVSALIDGVVLFVDEGGICREVSAGRPEFQGLRRERVTNFLAVETNGATGPLVNPPSRNYKHLMGALVQNGLQTVQVTMSTGNSRYSCRVSEMTDDAGQQAGWLVRLIPPKPASELEQLREYRRAVGQAAHDLNNEFTVLQCQWDLAFGEMGTESISDQDVAEIAQRLSKAAQVARFITVAGRECPSLG